MNQKILKENKDTFLKYLSGEGLPRPLNKFAYIKINLSMIKASKKKTNNKDKNIYNACHKGSFSLIPTNDQLKTNETENHRKHKWLLKQL